MPPPPVIPKAPPGDSLSLRCNIMQTPASDRFEAHDDMVISVIDGGIEAVTPAAAFSGSVDETLSDDLVLVPGLIDLHAHAPQWPQLGTGLDLPLEEWLLEYTFPLEARFEDLEFAQAVWQSMVPTLLANGTTTAVYYSSIHGPATTALAEACVEHGQRAFVGRVAMDHPEGAPDWYCDESATAAVAASAASIEAIRALNCPLVEPIVTPRFLPACTDELMIGLAELAESTGTLLQTHCSESEWEHQYVLDRFGVSDTEALASLGVLRPSTVLAHAVHLSSADMARIASAGAGVAHCPFSNVYFGDGVFPARRAIAAGVAVGLGTDIAGGPSPSLFANAAQAVNSSRQLEAGVDPAVSADERGVQNSRIDAVAAFWMATLGGATVLDRPLGLLEPGRRFDALAVRKPLDGLAKQPSHTDVDLFEKLVRRTTAADIERVWVDGRELPPNT